MTLTEALLREFDLETRYTRMMLERVPYERFDWKPHDKSMTMGWLATFLAVLPDWCVRTLQTEYVDAASSEEGEQRSVAASHQALLDLFDRNTLAARSALTGTSDRHLLANWSLKAGNVTIFTQPRYLALRTYVFNHTVHHRAQLGIYLRLNGIPVPAIYADSGDEKGGMFMEAAVEGRHVGTR